MIAFYSDDTLKIACRADSPFEENPYYFEVTQRIEVTFPLEKLDRVKQELTIQAKKLDVQHQALKRMTETLDAFRDRKEERNYLKENLVTIRLQLQYFQTIK